MPPATTRTAARHPQNTPPARTPTARLGPTPQRNTWLQGNVGDGGVVNQVTGHVSGKVVQAATSRAASASDPQRTVVPRRQAILDALTWTDTFECGVNPE